MIRCCNLLYSICCNLVLGIKVKFRNGISCELVFLLRVDVWVWLKSVELILEVMGSRAFNAGTGIIKCWLALCFKKKKEKL